MIKRFISSHFWKLEKIWSKISFQFLKIFFAPYYAFFDLKIKDQFRRGFLSFLIRSLFWPSLVFGVCYGFDRLFLAIPGIIIFSLDNNTLSIVLGISYCLLGIDGVLIGLYLASATAVYSSHYSAKSDGVRMKFVDLLSQWAWLLVANFIFQIGFVCLASLGQTISVAFFAFDLFFLVLAVLRFVFLMKKIFALANPYALSFYFFKDLQRIARVVLSRSIFSSNPSFQNFLLGQSERNLLYLSEIEEDRPPFSEPASSSQNAFAFDSNCVSFFFQTLKIKDVTPQDSLWFPKKAIYKNWIDTKADQAMIAIQTGASLSLDEKTNFYALSDLAFDLIFDPILRSSSLGENRPIDHSSMGEVIEAFDDYLSSEWGLRNARYLFDKINHFFTSYFEKESGVDAYLTSCVLNLPVGYLLGLNKGIRFLCKIFKESSFIGPLRKGPETVRKYANGLFNDKSLLCLSESLRAEKEAAGVAITPDWYLKEVVFRALGPLMGEIGGLIQKDYEMLEKAVTNCKAKGMEESCCAAAIVLRGLLSKADICIRSFDDCIVSYNALHMDKNPEVKSFVDPIPIDFLLKKKGDLISLFDCFFALYKKGRVLDENHLDYFGYAINNLFFDAEFYLTKDDKPNFLKILDVLFRNLDSINALMASECFSFDNPNFYFTSLTSFQKDCQALFGAALLYADLTEDKSFLDALFKVLDGYYQDSVKGSERCKISLTFFESYAKIHPNFLSISEHGIQQLNMDYSALVKGNASIKTKPADFYGDPTAVCSSRLATAFHYRPTSSFNNNFTGYFAIRYFNDHLSKKDVASGEGWENG